jgi:hypothetical protein
MTEGLRFSDMLGRAIAVEWFEGVALVRAVAEGVVADFGGSSVPDLHQVELSADGDVSILGAMESRDPVRRLGQFLQAVLTQSEPPVQLRLLIAQATAPEPAFGSVQEIADALGYFERPDRAGVLRRLHARALSAAYSSAAISPTLDLIAPVESKASSQSDSISTAPKTNRRTAALMIGAVVFIVSVLVSYWSFGGQARGANVAAMAVKASDAVGGAVVSGISKVSETVGLGRLASADPSGSVPPASLPAAPAPAPSKPTRKPAPVIRGGTPDPLLLFDLDGAIDSAPARDPATTRSTQEGAPPQSGAVAAVPVDPTIYSAADAGIEPPVGVRPQLPRALPADINKDQLGQIELLILPDGTVASVKLIGPHRGVIEGMLLSAAKAWTFQPALKNGQPVSYRKRVWLVLP